MRCTVKDFLNAIGTNRSGAMKLDRSGTMVDQKVTTNNSVLRNRDVCQITKNNVLAAGTLLRAGVAIASGHFFYALVVWSKPQKVRGLTVCIERRVVATLVSIGRKRPPKSRGNSASSQFNVNVREMTR